MHHSSTEATVIVKTEKTSLSARTTWWQKTLRTPNDARNINYTTNAQKTQVQIQGTVATSLQRSGLQKRPGYWGANVVCLRNLASHVTTCNLIRQGIIHPREGSWQRNRDLEVGQRSRSVRAKTPSPELIGHWVKIELITSLIWLRKYNTTSKRQ